MTLSLHKMSHLLHLPDDMILEIISWIPKIQRIKLILVNKTFRKYCFRLLQPVDTKEKFNQACRSGDILSLIYNKVTRWANWNYALKIACKSDYTSLVKFILSRKIEEDDEPLDLFQNLYRVSKMESSDGSRKGGSPKGIERLLSERFSEKDTNDIKFLIACKRGDIKTVKLLNPLNVLTDEGFLRACKAGHIDIVKFLFGSVMVNTLDNALFKAAKRGHLDIIKYLISKGVDELHEGLHGSIKGGHLDIAKFMIEAGSENLTGALYDACKKGNLEIIKLLIQNITEIIDWDILLFYACYGGATLGIIEFIIGKGSNNWDTGLRGACSGGHFEIVKYMIDKGSTDFTNGLYHACIGGHLDIIKFLISKIKMSFQSEKDEKYINILNEGLSQSCLENQGEAAELMITYGANDFNRVLISAAKEGHRRMVKLMIEYGANNLSDALYHSIMEENNKVSRYLIDQFTNLDEFSVVIGKCITDYGEDLYEENIWKYILNKLKKSDT